MPLYLSAVAASPFCFLHLMLMHTAQLAAPARTMSLASHNSSHILSNVPAVSDCGLFGTTCDGNTYLQVRFEVAVACSVSLHHSIIMNFTAHTLTDVLARALTLSHTYTYTHTHACLYAHTNTQSLSLLREPYPSVFLTNLPRSFNLLLLLSSVFSRSFPLHERVSARVKCGFVPRAVLCGLCLDVFCGVSAPNVLSSLHSLGREILSRHPL